MDIFTGFGFGCMQDVTLPGINRLEGTTAELPTVAEDSTTAAGIASGQQGWFACTVLAMFLWAMSKILKSVMRHVSSYNKQQAEVTAFTLGPC